MKIILRGDVEVHLIALDSKKTGIQIALNCHCDALLILGDSTKQKVGAHLKLWKSVIVTAMGFLLGMVLAGVGGLSAETLFYNLNSSENNKNIETYWADSGIEFSDVESLISNFKCQSSEKYFQACVSSVVQTALNYKLKISATSGNLESIKPNDFFDELTEKQILNHYMDNKVAIDFNHIVKKLFFENEQQLKAKTSGLLVNYFLSIYFDPHTYLMPTEFYNQVGSKLDRSKYFVGFSYEKVNGNFYIQKLSKNSDAELAGLKVDDKLISINNIFIKNLDYSHVSQILRNENTTKFNIEVERNHKIENIVFNRSYRVLSHVQYNVINDYGLVTLSKFGKGVCRELSDTLKDHSLNNKAGLILDLRDNPGGQLDEAACIAGLFLGKNKKAYYVEYFDKDKSNEVVLTSEDQLYKGPLVVLVNNRSASASESLSGALQEYKRAVVVGRRTFGKGTFQEPEIWNENSKISLFKTQGLYLLPSRNSTQLVGVKPDYELSNSYYEKREENIYFNPIHRQTQKYPKLKKSELVGNFNFKNCNNSKLNFSNADVYLQKSLELLSCAHEIKMNLAQANESNLN